jgi:branched-subunit amino acid ABC-type transport system permease component
MRLKLVIIASLLAAITGAGATIAVVLALFSSLRPIFSPDLIVMAAFLLPSASSLAASIFVYRHTARRRKLQAFLTAILSILLSLATLVIASIVTARLTPTNPPPPQQRNII